MTLLLKATAQMIEVLIAATTYVVTYLWPVVNGVMLIYLLFGNLWCKI